MASRGCKHLADAFFYNRGEFKNQERKSALWQHLLICVRLQVIFRPTCRGSRQTLRTSFHLRTLQRRMIQRENRAIKFVIPQIWRGPTDHSRKCLFCMMDTSVCCHISRPSVNHHHSATLPWVPTHPYPLFYRETSRLQKRTEIQNKMKLLIQITEAQLKRKIHTTPTKKPSTIWSDILVSQSPMPRFSRWDSSNETS